MSNKDWTDESLAKACRYWQEKLGLSHWRIAVRFARLSEMKGEGDDREFYQGSNKFDIRVECALIKICDPQDYPIDTPFEQDVEVTLVHELLHISVDYFARPDTTFIEHSLMEAFIDRMAWLLVELDRASLKSSEEAEEPVNMCDGDDLFPYGS